MCAQGSENGKERSISDLRKQRVNCSAATADLTTAKMGRIQGRSERQKDDSY